MQHIQTPKPGCQPTNKCSSHPAAGVYAAATVTMCRIIIIITALYYLEGSHRGCPLPRAHVGCFCRMHRNKTFVSAVGRLVSPSARPHNRLRPWPMTMTMQSKDRPAVPFRVCGQPCHALKSLIWKSPIRPWSGHGDGGSDCGRFASSGLGQTNTGPFQPASVGPLRDPQNRKGLVLTRSTGGRRRICLRETLEECPTPPSTQRRGRRLVALDRQRWDSGPPGHTHGPHLPFPVGFSLRSCPPAADHSDVRDEGRGTPCEATATHEPQTPPSLSLRLRTPLVVIYKCILPPFLNHKFSSVSLH